MSSSRVTFRFYLFASSFYSGLFLWVSAVYLTTCGSFLEKRHGPFYPIHLFLPTIDKFIALSMHKLCDGHPSWNLSHTSQKKIVTQYRLGHVSLAKAIQVYQRPLLGHIYTLNISLWAHNFMQTHIFMHTLCTDIFYKSM